MADRDFEAELERLFQQAPPAPDAEAFAERVCRRMDRSWRFRNWAVGGAGAVGGVIAVTQVLGSNLGGEARALAERSQAGLQTVFADGLSRYEGLFGLNGSGAVYWVAAAALALAGVAGALRLFEEV